jgi:acyl carrier protein
MRVKQFINSNRATPIENNDEPLHLDSLEFLRVTTFIQNELGFSLSDDDLTVDNFATINRIRTLLKSKATAA